MFFLNTAAEMVFKVQKNTNLKYLKQKKTEVLYYL